MSRAPAWKWLFSRFSSRRAPQAAVARPCLPAIEQLDDRVLPSVSTVDAFLKYENAFIKGEASFIKGENIVIQQYKEQVPSAVSAFFLKLDADFVKIDTTLASTTEGGATTGIDGVLIKLDLSSEEAGAAAYKIKTEVADLKAAAALLQNPGIDVTAAAAVDTFIKLDGIEHKGRDTAEDFQTGFIKIEADFLKLDPVNLKEPAAALKLDLGALAADAAAPHAVERFIKLQESFLKFEEGFIKLENAFIKYGGDKPAAVTDYFLKLDGALIKIADDLIGAPAPKTTDAAVIGGVGGIDGALLKLDLPPNISGEIQDKWAPEIAAIRQEVQNAAAQLGQGTTGSPTFDAASVDFLKYGGGFEIFAKHKADVLDTAFLKIQVGLVALAPDSLSGPVATLLGDLNGLATHAHGGGGGAG
jgi:hypothetical protein